MDLVTPALRKPETIDKFTLADWNIFIRQARAASLLATFGKTLQSTAVFETVPEEVKRHLLSAEIYAARQQKAVLYEVRKLKQIFPDKPVRFILLKGAAYVYKQLPASDGRTMTDIDIMVKKDELPTIERTLLSQGWSHAELDDYDDRYYRNWAHEIPPLKHGGRGTSLDVHHSIFPVISRYSPDITQIWNNTVFAEDNQIGVLCREDMIIHSATHLFMEGDFDKGLRDLNDINSLLKELKGKNDWESLARRARLLNLEEPVFYAIRYCQRLIGSQFPEDHTALSILSTSPNKLKMMDFLFGRALRPHHSTAECRFFKFALFILFIRGHLIKMPLHILLPHLFKKAIKGVFKSKKDEHSLGP
ncbi:MAG: hypothetical protein CSB48_05590 [Proteobacteria bacterium]|nr:MAG: hypothetical protein CSB48_05590 [Pseudomonadota bacterium]